MAKLTWTIDHNAATLSEDSPTVSDVQMDRFIDWLWYAYPQLDENGDVLPRTLANEAQAFRDWANIQWLGTKANVIRWERSEAAQAASDAVQDLS